MEAIELRYVFKAEDGSDGKEIRTVRKDENGLHDYDVCEMFLDFMRSVGFSDENVIRYFNT